MMAQKKGKIGSSFEDYLKAEGALEETNTLAVKRVLARPSPKRFFVSWTGIPVPSVTVL